MTVLAPYFCNHAFFITIHHHHVCYLRCVCGEHGGDYSSNVESIQHNKVDRPDYKRDSAVLLKPDNSIISPICCLPNCAYAWLPLWQRPTFSATRSAVTIRHSFHPNSSPHDPSKRSSPHVCAGTTRCAASKHRMWYGAATTLTPPLHSVSEHRTPGQYRCIQRESCVFYCEGTIPHVRT